MDEVLENKKRRNKRGKEIKKKEERGEKRPRHFNPSVIRG